MIISIGYLIGFLVNGFKNTKENKTELNIFNSFNKIYYLLTY